MSAHPPNSHGIPTPPYSETTSSIGDRSNNTASDQLSKRSLQKSESQSRSPSASSSRTGSETVGATSPAVSQGEFQSQSRPEMVSPPRLARKSLESVRSSPSSDRTRRSIQHEREVNQLRSESRLGSRIDEHDTSDRISEGIIAMQHRFSPRKSTKLITSSDFRGDDEDRDTLLTGSRASIELYDRASRYAAGGKNSSVRQRTFRDTETDTLATSRPSRGAIPSEFRVPDKEVRKAYRAARAGQSSDSDDNAETSRASKPASNGAADSHAHSDFLALRARKESTASARSQKSSNSASELHRAAHGGPPVSFPRSASPSIRTELSCQSTPSDRTGWTAEGSPQTPGRALEDLRMQIEDLHISDSSSKRSMTSFNDRPYISGSRSSAQLRPSVRDQLHIQTPTGLDQVRQLPMSEPPRSRMTPSRIGLTTGPSTNAVSRINNLIEQRMDSSPRHNLPLRSSTSMSTFSDRLTRLASFTPQEADLDTEPAPIRNMAVRFAQLQNLYSKVSISDDASTTVSGPQTLQVVELLGAIVKGTSSMWSEMSRMHPIATESHLLGASGDAATNAFGQLDEGFAFLTKLTLEHARAVQDLLFLLDRMEKERQTQFNQVLQELGHSPRPFSRIGAERAPSSLGRAINSVRSTDSTSTGSPFARLDRGATLTSSQLRSMTSLGHSSNHIRSASELSPSSSAAQRRMHRTRPSEDATLASPRNGRERGLFKPLSSRFSDSLDAAPASLSSASRPPPSFTPRRSRPSNPSVSNATASYQPSAASTSPDASMSNARLSTGSGASDTGDTGHHTASSLLTDTALTQSPTTSTQVTKSPKPPRPPRHTQRQAEDTISSLLPFPEEAHSSQSPGHAASRRVNRILGGQVPQTAEQ